MSKVTIEIEVDEGWIDFAVNHNDLFMRGYCGYWLHGVAKYPDGWLCYVDNDGEGGEPGKAEAEAAITAWKAGEALPASFCRLDRQVAIEAFKQGVLWRGLEWYENGDANSYDHVIQMALLGSVVYG